MIYAHVTAGSVDAIGAPPLTVFLDGRWWDLRDRNPETLASVGWYVVTEAPRPSDTSVDTWYLTYVVTSGVPTQVWTSRPKTQAEIDAATAETNRTTLTQIQQLQGRLDRLAAYATDTDIVEALNRANTTAPTTQELNRLIKTMLRRQARQDAALSMLMRLIDPALLGTITDTTDA